MPFNIKDYSKKSNYPKAEFLQLTPGRHVVRILETPNEALMVETHFLVTPTGRFSVKCLGEDCPICTNNRKIYLSNPKNYRNEAGYFSKSDRYTFNVLDRTVVKTCPKCSTTHIKIGQNFPAACVECGTMLVSEEAKPLNKVKLAQISKTLATQLNSIENAVTDTEGNPIGITTYDVVFLVEEVSGKKNVTPMPAANNNDVVNVSKEQLLDKNLGTLVLSADEILDALKGVSLKDILTARKQPQTAEPVEQKTASPSEKEVQDLVAKRIKELLGEK